MSTLKSINVIHPSSAVNNIVNDSSGNVTAGANLYVPSGNVGIGTSSPANFAGTVKLVVGSAATTTTAGAVTVYSGTATYGGLYFADGTVGDQLYRGAVEYNHSTDALLMYSAGTERMRIDSSGNFLISGTVARGQQTLYWDSSAINGLTIMTKSSTFTNAPILFLNGSAGLSGFIGQTGSAVSYNTSSDYRLKTDIQPMLSGLETIAALKPVTYKWLADESDGEGFIAHELKETIPLAVSGEKDAVNEDGSIRPQGVDYSKIVVHLVAAIQELSAKNDALEARLVALEAK